MMCHPLDPYTNALDDNKRLLRQRWAFAGVAVVLGIALGWIADFVVEPEPEVLTAEVYQRAIPRPMEFDFVEALVGSWRSGNEFRIQVLGVSASADTVVVAEAGVALLSEPTESSIGTIEFVWWLRPDHPLGEGPSVTTQEGDR